MSLKFFQKRINLKVLITKTNIKLIIYDLNFGILYNLIFLKKLNLFFKYKLYLIEFLFETGILKIKS